jgi:hypothetical protein
MDAAWDVLDEVDSRLRDRADELVEHFRGAPDKASSTRRTVRFGKKGGLAVDIVGPNTGRITDYNDGGNKAQSPLQFIQSEIGSDFAGALQWAKAWLGIEGERPEPRVRREDPKAASAEAEREEAERRAKVGQIVAEVRDARRTPAEAYLRGRGITADLPDAVRWRDRAWGKYGSLVLLATDAAGAVRAVQQVYVTADGAKAPLKVQKRTNGRQPGAAVRLPGTAPLTLIEGPETGLSAWQATGNETWIALGGIGKLVDQVPAGSEVIVGRDADPKGGPADKGLWRAVEALVARGCRVRLACPPYNPVWRKPDQKKVDFNDVLKNEDEAAIRAIFAAAEVFGREKAPDIDEAVASAKRAPGLLDCAAYFPTDRLAPEIAGLELVRAITRFLDEATLYLRVTRDFNAAVEAAKDPARAAAAEATRAILDGVDQDVADHDRTERLLFRRMMRQARREAMADVCARYGIERLPKPPRLQLKASAGIGKTTKLAEELAKRPELIEEFHIHFYVARHDLTEKLAATIPGSRIMRGRSFGAGDDEPMCRRHQAAEKIARAGLPVFENICRREDGACPHFEACDWVRQWRDHAPGVRILPHAFLILPKPLGMPPADLVIVDESVVQTVTGSTSFTPCRITKHQFRPGHVDQCMAHDRTADAVAVAIQAGGAELAQARDLDLTAERLREAAKFEEGGDTAPRIGPGLSDAAIMKRVDEWERSEGGRLAKFYRALAAEIDLPRDAVHGIELKRDCPVKVKKDEALVDERQDRVFVHWLRRVMVPVNAALLLIDADASLAVNRRIFGDRLEEQSIRVRRNAHVIQVHSTRSAKYRLTAGGPDADRMLRQVRALIERESREGKRVLVVTYKAVRCLLTGENPEDDIGPYGRCGTAAVAHFGNIRGSDDFKDCDTVVVIGRYQPPVHAVESAARALWASDPEPLRLLAGDGRWSTETRGYTLRTGERSGVEIERHPDDRAQLVLELMREAETVQSVDRLRLVHRTGPGRVLLISNLPVDVEVDELTDWKALMAMGVPNRLQQAFDQGGAVPLSGAELFRCFDKLWVSACAAKNDLQREVNGSKTPIEILLGKRPYLIRANYRRVGQRGRATPAVIRADAPDPRAALESVVGPVDWFEVEQMAEPAAEAQAEPAAEAEPVNTPVSQIDANPADPAGRVVQFPPSAVKELHRLQRIVSAAGRLADLSARLDVFRPPPGMARRPERVAVLQ